MKVGLIQIDGKWPNLALRKLKTYHKNNNDEIVDPASADRVYISCIFTWNRPKTLGIAQFYRTMGKEVIVGGSGIDLTTNLSPEIENCIADWDDLDYDIGFTSRGCIRSCPFCFVPKKEGSIQEKGIAWIKKDKVMLLDNNFLASPKAVEKLEWFIETQKKVCFTQGLDIRLITHEFAELLSKVNYRDTVFGKKRLYFAFDDPQLERIVKEKIAILREHGIQRRCLLFYVLVGFNTTLEQDLHRIRVLDELTCLPFIMLYNHKKDRTLRKLARWINRRYYKICTWQEYKTALA